jgi:hypothetical protein
MAKLPKKYRRTDLMTAEELNKRYKPNKALALSIEKWVRARLKENWEELKGKAYEYLWGEECGLCTKYQPSDCAGCPLPPCTSNNSPWILAFHAADKKDRAAFMRASKNLLARMRRAYDRGER